MSHLAPDAIIEALATLHRLRALTDGEQPYMLAPQHWIDELHLSVAALIVAEDQERFRLESLAGINLTYLHRHVGLVLAEVERTQRHDVEDVRTTRG